MTFGARSGRPLSVAPAPYAILLRLTKFSGALSTVSATPAIALLGALLITSHQDASCGGLGASTGVFGATGAGVCWGLEYLARNAFGSNPARSSRKGAPPSPPARLSSSLSASAKATRSEEHTSELQ